jgi:hypothetical protein
LGGSGPDEPWLAISHAIVPNSAPLIGQSSGFTGNSDPKRWRRSTPFVQKFSHG